MSNKPEEFMKKIIALAAALLSVSTFALSANDSWDTIKSEVSADWDLSFAGTTVFVGRPVSAFDVCLDGDQFVTTREFPIYEIVKVGKSHPEADEDGYASVIVGYEILSFPTTYTSYKEVCRNDDKNCKRVPYTVNQDLTKNVSVKEVVRRNVGSNDRTIEKTLFKKEYVIPACN